MKFLFEKFTSNKIDSTFKEKTNKNSDIFNAFVEWTKSQLIATNNRINNLILKSGGNSPNEVVDARTGFDGVVHEVLKDRLDKEAAYFKGRDEAFDELMEKYSGDFEELKLQLKRLYGEYNETIDLYVSKEGSNTSGDGSEEKPYLTIQKAVDTIPLISTATYVVWIDKGTYKEDVIINSIRAREIYIKTINYDTTNPTIETGVNVRSFSIENSDSYVYIGGITFVDHQNIRNSSLGVFSHVFVDLSKYISIQRCRFVENTKNRTDKFAAVQAAGASNVTIGSSTNFVNQKTCIYSTRGANINIAGILGSDNEIGFSANFAVIRSDKTSLKATTMKVETNGGQVLGIE
ncbi:hypothetical protein [Vagococcus fluvialis]|uniref:hypothetical protein n=1 Tax=Vagococcus fluvialis TaxID=2738 RepID=UPI002B31DC0B|nr:hypothetical protein QDW48_06515 [Vagococcus fluvialis]